MTGNKLVIPSSETLQDNLNLPERSSLRRICFTGVRGVGKSSVLQEINKEDINVCFTSGSDILQYMMGDAYSQFEFFPEYKKYGYRLKIRDTLHKIQEENGMDLLVDSHLTVYNLKSGEIDVIFTHMDYEFYTDIILLDSYPERILDHRQRDTKKKRITNLAIIRDELNFERRKAAEISKRYGIRLHVVQMGEDAAEKMIDILFRCKV
ncbi:MAG: AAA family ATPase [Methanomethylovorans sp.]|uniref:AAA family ATPase n=1 Tax=Methanomethylovorans sp. TaxID=2758717 RepID=UPI003530F488